MIQSSAQNHIFYDDVHGAQNHYFYGCEQCAKMGGGATIYYVYMYVRTPPMAGIQTAALRSMSPWNLLFRRSMVKSSLIRL